MHRPKSDVELIRCGGWDRVILIQEMQKTASIIGSDRNIFQYVHFGFPHKFRNEAVYRRIKDLGRRPHLAKHPVLHNGNSAAKRQRFSLVT